MPQWQWAVVLAALDPFTGIEQAGTRPVLIVSNEDTNQALHRDGASPDDDKA